MSDTPTPCELNCHISHKHVYAPSAPQASAWEGDLPTEHLNRCKLRDNLLYADIFNEDGTHRRAWRCHKREGHDGPCSSHNDCGVMNGSVVCSYLPGHQGPHAWATAIRATGGLPLPASARTVTRYTLKELQALFKEFPREFYGCKIVLESEVAALLTALAESEQENQKLSTIIEDLKDQIWGLRHA